MSRGRQKNQILGNGCLEFVISQGCGGVVSWTGGYASSKENGMGTNRKSAVAIATGLLASVTLIAAGCANEGSTGDASGGAAQSADNSQQVKAQSGASGEGCTIDDYGVPKLDLKDAVVGFSQSEPDSAAFRATETQSIRDAAQEVGVKNLIVTNANNELPKQINDIQDMLSQGVDILIVAPVNSDGLDPALQAAADKKVPVVTIDRKVTNEPCKDYLAFIGSDFVDQGKRAADLLAQATNETANVAVLLGPSGNNVTDGRQKGFEDQVAANYPNMKIVAEQTANASRSEGQEVTAQLLQSNPEINAIYAFNDEEGLGAMTAVSDAGLKPGTDVKIVSIDGTRNAVEAIVNGTYNGVIESNPRFGPLVFETLQKFYSGEAIPENIVIQDGQYTPDNAEADLGKSF